MTIGLLDRANLRPPTDVYRVPQTVVAVRRVLRRSEDVGLDASDGISPRLYLALEEQTRVTDARLLTLLDLIEDRRGTGRPTVLSATCGWSRHGAEQDLVRLAVRAAAPIRLAVDIVLPVRPLRRDLRQLARGGAIALVTARQAGDLLAGPGTTRTRQTGLLIPCQPSTVLAGLVRRHEGESTGRHRLTG